ncbi:MULTISPECIES: vWA domain-containing protein [Vibrio]|uniref:VWA domain-containing protein n=1 Tax=Vibrio algicola TaxID=2662262 RepID=A0A5Q0TGV3_9VIBR|nr:MULTISPECIES: VWA domain-containing protein [Vibrio]MBD1577804.1 VWA domain-containing protein [Vibrio sp. S11_S32]
MFEFHWWWMVFALPLPLIIYYFAPAHQQRTAITLPTLPEQGAVPKAQHISLKILALLIWLLLVTAAARPVWYGKPIEFQPKHRDMMLVVDLSGSMAQEDMNSNNGYIDRLSAVKQVLNHFISERKGDRLGLVLFADHAYLQTPLTLDRQTVQQQLNRAQLNMIGTQTAIGEGIGIATKTFIKSEAKQRVMVLLSDGGNTAGVIEPLEAAKIAKDNNAIIYTVGIGAGEIQTNGFFGTRTVNTSQDLDEKTLTEIAKMTGGQYFRAKDKDQLDKIYQTINQLQPVTNATQTWRPQSEWFSYPLALALILSFVLAILRRRHG